MAARVHTDWKITLDAHALLVHSWVVKVVDSPCTKQRGGVVAFTPITFWALVASLCTCLTACSEGRSKALSPQKTRPMHDSGSHAQPVDDDVVLDTLSPGTVVPLLYGRKLNVEQHGESWVQVRQLVLGKPDEGWAGRFFADLSATCLDTLPGATLHEGPRDCARERVKQAALARCRASAALGFSLARERAGIAYDGLLPRTYVDSRQNERNQRWSWKVANARERASWAMLAVQELRGVISTLSPLFDESCKADLAAEWSEGLTVGDEVASLLDACVQELPKATELADEQLRAQLAADVAGNAELDQLTRRALTRGLNDSLLERMKLYAGVPYGSFEAADPHAGVNDRRYPVSPDAPDAQTRSAIALLVATETEAVSQSGKAYTGSALSERWFDALRETVPLVFGSLGNTEAEAALRRFRLSTGSLEQGARWLAAAAAVAGTALSRQALAHGTNFRLRGLASMLPGPSGYPYALTEALATRAPDKRIVHGLTHALDAAARIALDALARDDLGDAKAAFARLARGANAAAEVCEELRAGESLLRVRIDHVASDMHGYHLYEGDELAREVAGHYEASSQVLQYEIRPSAGAVRYYLVDAAAKVVAAFGYPLLEPNTQEQCWSVLLSAQLHADLQRVSSDDVVPALKRSVTVPEGDAPFRLEADDATPVLWQRTLTLTHGKDASTVDLGNWLSTFGVRLQQGLTANCGGRAHAELACAPYADQALTQRCLAQGIVGLADSSADTTSEWHAQPKDEGEKKALALWAFEARKLQLVSAAQALASFQCKVSASTDVQELERTLWQSAADAASDLVASLDALRATEHTAQEAKPLERERALHGSALARARLFVAVPYGSYEPATADANVDVLEHALDRFPVVVHPATSAEDVRIETLLRRAGLDPLLPRETLGVNGPELSRVGAAYRNGALALTLRELMRRADPEHAKEETSAESYVSALGVSQTQLERAAARILQTAERSGVALLPLSNAEGQVYGSASAYAPPSSAHLFALTDGRAHLAKDAWPTSIGMRGPFHAISFAITCLAGRARAAQDWSLAERAERQTVLDSLQKYAGESSEIIIGLEDGPDRFSVVVPGPTGATVEELREQYELWWTDAGLRCATAGAADGKACDEAEYRLERATMQTTAADGRTMLSGFRLPRPMRWSPAASLQPQRGRVYLTRKEGSGRVVIAATTMMPDQSAHRSSLPFSERLSRSLIAELGLRPPGEDCARCWPRSVCETSSCQLGLCVRSPIATPRSCGVAAVCIDGRCSQPGCGDGDRSSGRSDVPYEACDDGNTESGDGCSNACEVESRSIDPLVREAYPAGRGPAVAMDGQGNALLLYTADSLVGDDARVEAALFDPFGARTGTVATVFESPRGTISDMGVVGLRGGGFASVESALDEQGRAVIGMRISSMGNSMGPRRAVAATDGSQSEPYIASQEDGFAVAWLERTSNAFDVRVLLRHFAASGEAAFPPLEVTRSTVSSIPSEVRIASSADQLLVTWSERDLQGRRLGIRFRRYNALGAAVDAADSTIASGEVGEPSIAVATDEDYLVAFSDFRLDPGGDIALRTVRRFGPALAGSEIQSIRATPEAERSPVIAASTSGASVLAFQQGSPSARTTLLATNVDAASLATAQQALAGSDRRDVGLVGTARGIWLTWSKPMEQSRGLYLVHLPVDSPAPPN